MTISIRSFKKGIRVSILLILHITGMVLGFAMLAAYATICHVAARSSSSEFVKSAFQAVSKLDLIGRITIIAGIIAGLLIARPFGYAAPWLLGAYLLMGLAIANGAAALEPFKRRLLAAAMNHTDFRALSRSRIPACCAIFNAVLWTTSIWLMVTKP